MAKQAKAKSKRKQDQPPLEQPFLEHLIELRDRLMRVVMVVLVVFLGLFYFANDIYSYFAQPLMRHLPQGSSMIATEVASPFLTPFKLTLVLSVFIAVPVILYQLWAFIAPGLYKHERRLIYPLLVSSTILFFVGVAFAYYVVLPLIFGFMVGIAPEGVAVMTDISKYLDFVLTVFFAFGIAFEVPIATILLIWSGIVSAADLASKRPFIIVGAFVVGAILTPPDVFSQTLLAIPMWLLFEVGLFCSRWYTKPRKAEDEDEGDGGDDGTPAPKKPAPSSPPPSTPGSGTTVQTTASGATAFTLGGVAASSDAEAVAATAPDPAPSVAVAAPAAPAEAVEEIQPTVKPPAAEDELRAQMAAVDREVMVDEDEHARATAEALARAKAAAGDIGDYHERPYVPPEEPVFTEEDHQRITAEAMARSWAAAGVPPPVRKPLPPEPAPAQDSPATDVTEQADAATLGEGAQTPAPEAPR